MPHRRKNNSDGSQGSQGSQEGSVKLAPPPPLSPLTAPPMVIGPMPLSSSNASESTRDISPAPPRPLFRSSRSISAVPSLVIETNVPAAPSKDSGQSNLSSTPAMTWKNRMWLPDASRQAISESPMSSTAMLTPPSLPVVRPIMERGVAKKEEGPGHVIFLSEFRRFNSSNSEETLIAGLDIDDMATVANVKELLVSELMPMQAKELGVEPRACLRIAVGNMLECLVQWDYDRAIARQTWPDGPPVMSSLPKARITPEEAAEVVERFRTAMCMLPLGEWRCRWANLEEDMLLALLKMTFRLARPILAWEMDTDLV